MTGWLNMKTPPNVERKANTCPQTIPKSRRGENTPKLIYKARFTLIQNLDKTTTRKLKASISDEYRCKNSRQNISNPKFNST